MVSRAIFLILSLMTQTRWENLTRGSGLALETPASRHPKQTGSRGAPCRRRPSDFVCAARPGRHRVSGQSLRRTARREHTDGSGAGRRGRPEAFDRRVHHVPDIRPAGPERSDLFNSMDIESPRMRRYWHRTRNSREYLDTVMIASVTPDPLPRDPAGLPSAGSTLSVNSPAGTPCRTSRPS